MCLGRPVSQETRVYFTWNFAVRPTTIITYHTGGNSQLAKLSRCQIFGKNFT